MKKNPIIGIIQRPYLLNNKKTYIGVYENYIKKIIINNGIPFIIVSPQNNIEFPLNDNEKEKILKILRICDGIISPGGDFIYDYDLFIYNYALDKDIPYLGICQGMQVMTNSLEKVDNHYQKYHTIKIFKNTKLYKIMDEKYILVNSRHHEKINNTYDYTISAISKENVIEAIEKKDKKFIIGVQWHPEDLKDNKIFNKFIESCKE